MTAPTGEASGTALIHMIWAFMQTQALHVAAKLSLFDALHDAPKNARDLSVATGADEAAVHRLLRFLTSVGLATEDDEERFSSTPLGDLLRSDHPQSVRGLAVMYGEPYIWNAWGDLFETVKTGTSHFERRHGGSLFDYLAVHPDAAAAFDAGMTSSTRVEIPTILEVYDFSRFTKIVDVGGGHGALLRAILERFPDTSGVLFDRPPVIAAARALATPRCELIEGDMFASVPAGGDAYMMKRILHDWNDDQAVRILRHCRRGIAAGGKVLVMDTVVQPPNRPDPAKWLDMNMLALLPGRERTEAELAAVFAQAGFRLTCVVPAGRLSIVEGVPA